MRMIRKFKNIIKNFFVNQRIKKYKYVHLMFNDKFNKPFVDFLNDQFDPKEHVILCKRWFREHPFPEGDNVIEIRNYQNISFQNNEKIICHSLFDNEVIDYLYKYNDVLKNKTYWVMWGGDLYNAPRDKINDFVRSNFKGYISVVEGDEERAKEIYNLTSDTLCSAPYIAPSFNYSDLYKTLINNPIEHSMLRIQINNSSDDSTLEMLETLAKFKDKNIIVTTILSYGKMQFKDQIIKKGKNIYGEKFEYIQDYMPIEQFIKYSASNDILICNQNRQQGLGNILSSLYLGKKVFVKSEITTVSYLNSFGLRLFDTNEIVNMDFNELKDFSEDIKLINIKNAEKFYTREFYVKKWSKIFKL